jgi:hypothetical protein
VTLPAWHPLLPFAETERSAAQCAQRLAEILGHSIRVDYGRSRSQPVRARFERARNGALRGMTVRVHRVFAQAPDEVVEALAAWLRSGRRARRASVLLDDWIERRLAALPRPAQPRLRTRGAHHDLAPLAEEVLATRFRDEFAPPRARPAIGWGRRARSRCRHSLQLASFDPTLHVVRVHPVLDRADVPAWFLAFLLFHELLHAALPSERGADGRLLHHGPAFRSRERSHPDHARAIRLERKILPRLLRAARRGTP